MGIPSKQAPCFTRLPGAVLIIAVLGCGGKSYQVAEVDGVVLIKGRPGHKIYVQFIPEVGGESSPPTSTAETDASGRFTLHLMEGGGGSTRPGAVVGHHRVVLRDLQLAASATGAGVPIRLPVDYTLAGTTPLTQEVKEGQQTIEINVP
jgi:hypothetical protein